VTAYVSAVLGVLVWWLEADLPYTPQEMDRVIERLMSLGMGRALGLARVGRLSVCPVRSPTRTQRGHPGVQGLVMRDAIIVANVVYYLLLILCGINFPVSRLPGAPRRCRTTWGKAAAS